MMTTPSTEQMGDNEDHVVQLIDFGIPAAAATKYAVSIAASGFLHLKQAKDAELSDMGVKKGHLRMIKAGIEKQQKKEAEALLAPLGDFSDWSTNSETGSEAEEAEEEDAEMLRLVAEDEARIAREESRFEEGLESLGKEQEAEEAKILARSR